MKVTSAQFIKSAFEKKDWPRLALPEVAFAGRSNVGKSTLINTLLNRKKLAKTSSSPGKTRCLNFFVINEKLSFTDLPGYGFARGDKEEVRRWKPMIEKYLTQRKELEGLIHIIDIRRKPDDLEFMLADWVHSSGMEHILVANKCDKLKKNAMIKALKDLEAAFGVKPLPHSSLKKVGKKELWSEIRRVTGV